jgi:hypothetical protein
LSATPWKRTRRAWMRCWKSLSSTDLSLCFQIEGKVTD